MWRGLLWRLLIGASRRYAVLAYRDFPPECRPGNADPRLAPAAPLRASDNVRRAAPTYAPGRRVPFAPSRRQPARGRFRAARASRWLAAALAPAHRPRA